MSKKRTKRVHPFTVIGCDSVVFPMSDYLKTKIDFAKKQMAESAIKAILRFANKGEYNPADPDAIAARLWNEQIITLTEVSDRLSVFRFNVVTEPEMEV